MIPTLTNHSSPPSSFLPVCYSYAITLDNPCGKQYFSAMWGAIATGIAVFIGILVGIAVQVGVTKYFQWRHEKNKLKNLKFEFELNVKKINRFLEEISRYKTAINAGSLNQYYGFFDLSKVISVTSNDMFFSGLLYKYLDHEDIEKLQVVFTDFSNITENILSKQIKDNTTQFDQKKAIGDAVFWENKFEEHKKTFEELLKKLS